MSAEDTRASAPGLADPIDATPVAILHDARHS